MAQYCRRCGREILPGYDRGGLCEQCAEVERRAVENWAAVGGFQRTGNVVALIWAALFLLIVLAFGIWGLIHS